MALTTRTLPALMNGISQQPPILRSPDQLEDEVNTWGMIATGLSRRPPTETIQKLTTLDLTDASTHHINRDISERYLVVMTSGGIQVFDETDGSEKVVNAPGGWAYMDAPGTAYRAITIADYTFIVNTEKVVELLDVGADEDVPDPFLRIPGGATMKFLDEVVYAALARAGGVYQYQPNPGGTATGTVARVEDLPATVCTGCIYEVKGAAETSFVSYYVVGDGTVWNETVKSGLKNKIDELTMPHALVREADGTFTFAPFSWQPRRVGDYATNPFPPFVGRTIRDVFFYQNRLGFLVDESVVFSAAGDYGDFWRRTVLDYIDSDTLAASAATTDVAVLDFAVPFSDGIMLFSKQRQFSLTNGESGLSAHSIAIQPVTTYIMSQSVRPSPLGSQVHFASDAKGYVAIQEYTRLAGADPTEASDISAHVPRLIPQGASQIISAPDLDAIFLLVRNGAEEEKSKVYVYQFFWDGDQKVQSAWRVWDFGTGKPVSGAYESGALHLLMERPDGFFLERINLSPSAVSEGQDALIYLDRGSSVTGVYNSGTDTTDFVVPFAPNDLSKLKMVRGNGATHPQSLMPTASIVSVNLGTQTITTLGDESGYPMTIGERFETRAVLSQQFAQDWQSRALTTGRLQLHTFTLNTIDTAYLRAEVFPYGRQAAEANPDLMHTQEFSGRRVGSTTLGQMSYEEGPFTFSVAAHSRDVRIEVVNDSVFSSTITSAEWEGLFYSRAMG